MGPPSSSASPSSSSSSAEEPAKPKPPASWDSSLIVLQANVKGSALRTMKLLHDARDSHHPPDVIAVQDPPKGLPWLGISPYRLSYATDRTLLEGDNPAFRGDKVKFVPLSKNSQTDKSKKPTDEPPNTADGEEDFPLHRTCFLVHSSIALGDWEVRYHEGENKRLAATLVLTIPGASTICIHSVYNSHKAVDIDQLVAETTTSGRDLLLGDFNLHHPWWGGRRAEEEPICPLANRLRRGLEMAGMECLTEPGTVTFTRGLLEDGSASTIDLTFASHEIASHTLYCRVREVLGFESDHRVVETALDLPPAREYKTRYQWRKVDREKFVQHVTENLQQVGLPELDTESQIDDFTDKILAVFKATMEKCVPLAPVPGTVRYRRRGGAALKRLTDLERSALQKFRRSPGRGWRRYWERCVDRRRQLEKADGTNSWRNWVAGKERESQGLYRTARLAQALCQPREQPHMPPLTTADGVVHKTEEDKARCLRDNTWRNTSDGEAAPPLARPHLDPGREQLWASQDVDQPEVVRLITGLPTGKSAGPDRISNEALKLTCDVVAPYLTHAFAACLRLSHHPTGFKHATTVILPKPEKDTLDIKGAFDLINRLKQLDSLADKRVPDWLVTFVWSFLSDRSTALQMRGSTSEPFWVNVGIPQGSPLSPILFLFFAAPSIEEACKVQGAPAEVHVFAYIDDTYLLAVSSDYDRNCKALEMYHERIMEWALAAGVEFSPQKYYVMHFKAPWSRSKTCSQVPKIPGLTDAEKHLKTEARVLGVTIDSRLKFAAHIDHLTAKVLRKLRHLQRMSGSTWGASLQGVRQLYLTKIRPVISYACAACGTCRASTLQYTCLLQISGAMKGTPQRVLEKELNIDSIGVFLARMSTAQRARVLADSERIPLGVSFVDSAPKLPRGKKAKVNPYDLLDMEARKLCDRVRSECIARAEKGGEMRWHIAWKRNKAINEKARHEAIAESARVWANHCRRSAQRVEARGAFPCLAMKELWGPQSLQYYKGLTRAQSTMLLQCRTEVIGLNLHLSRKKVCLSPVKSGRAESSDLILTTRCVFQLVESPACPCGAPKQSVHHMFIMCEDLEHERQHLRDKVGFDDFNRLMTEQTSTVADWAITYFDLDQYAWPRKYSVFGPRKKQSHSLFEGT
ncbi:hypothetical protein ACJZ2D_014222 [Fusarium nematophilum]